MQGTAVNEPTNDDVPRDGDNNRESVESQLRNLSAAMKKCTSDLEACARDNSLARQEVERLRKANELLREENKIIPTIRCVECEQSATKQLIYCRNELCKHALCAECLQERLGTYASANVGKEIYSCHSCNHAYDALELQRFGGVNYARSLVFFAQAVKESIRKRKRGDSMAIALDPEDKFELLTLTLPCCNKTKMTDFGQCACLTCTFCKQSTCAWCFAHMPSADLGIYHMHEHIKTCARNPNQGHFTIDTPAHVAQLTVTMQSHQAKQICRRMDATAIGDTSDGAAAVHS